MYLKQKTRNQDSNRIQKLSIRIRTQF